MFPDNANLIMDMDTIAETVSRGNCILFLGAAIHFPPSPELVKEHPDYAYPEKHRPPLGREFSEQLAKQANFQQTLPNDSITNLQRVAQNFEIRKSRNLLVEEIKKAVFYEKQPSPLLRMLAQLNFPIVITTNYDKLFETALTQAGKNPIVSIYKKQELPSKDYPYAMVSPQEPFVFKIHGDINEGESIVITEEDYIDFVLRMSSKQQVHPVPLTIQYYLVKCPTLFIGYSLRDYNLRLLFKTLRWKIDAANFPKSYSVDLYPDPLVFRIYHDQNNYVSFLSEDVWKFVPELFNRVKQIEQARI